VPADPAATMLGVAAATPTPGPIGNVRKNHGVQLSGAPEEGDLDLEEAEPAAAVAAATGSTRSTNYRE
jgi:hypothetical protein